MLDKNFMKLFANTILYCIEWSLIVERSTHFSYNNPFGETEREKKKTEKKKN